MAQYFELERPLVISWIWNVSGRVSPYQYSQRPDVMLVQHALNTLMAHLKLTDDSGNLITSYLKRDGYMGPKTNQLILSYQRSLRARGYYVKADGVVDPSSRSGWTPDGQGQYTIVYLNREHCELYGTMMKEEDFPELLQQNLRINRNLR
jgi:hypothetical protein